MERLLYYPYISIPKTSWLIQALLYWDGISTIVPLEYLERPWNFTPFARELVQEGIIRTVPPDEYAYSNYKEYQSFLKWIDDEKLDQFSLNSGSADSNITKQYNLHIGKLGFLGDELKRRGLAKQIDDRWYSVKKDLSTSFMTFLAILISREENYIPATDTYRGCSSLFNIEKYAPLKNSRVIRNKFRNSILNDVLPIPSSIDNYGDILRFKEKHNEQLISFRKHIEGFIVTLEGKEETLQEELCRKFIADLQEEMNDIKGKMGYFKAPEINLGTLIPILSSSVTFLNNFSSNGCSETILSLISPIHQIIHNDKRKENLKKPIAYAAIYQEHFMKTPPNRG